VNRHGTTEGRQLTEQSVYDRLRYLAERTRPALAQGQAGPPTTGLAPRETAPGTPAAGCALRSYGGAAGR
jgi:hypothetical protein